MRGFHFSLRWLFGVVSFLAVGCGLLIYASPILSKLTFTLVVSAFLAAILAAIHHAGHRRAFWAGFATFGFAYLWLVCSTWQSPDGSNALRERLVTNDLLIRCQESLPSKQTTVAITPQPYMSGPVSFTVGQVIDPTGTIVSTGTFPAGTPWNLSAINGMIVTTSVDRTDFLATGHSLFAFLFALLGGVLGQYCFCRAQRLRTQPSDQPAGSPTGNPVNTTHG